MQRGRRHGERAARQPGAGGGVSLLGDDFFDLFDSAGFEDDDLFGSPRSSPSALGSVLGGERPVKAAPIEHKLPCTMEELYAGTTRRMKITRLVADADASGTGGTVPAEDIVTIEVKPGWKKGTRITFPERGNERPNTVPADVVFVVDEKPHLVFARDSDDLVATCRAPLAGRAMHLTALDGRGLTVPVSRSAVRPGCEVVVRGEGMPVPRKPSRRGDVRVRFDGN
ncbi:dnaJ homolog subfamily B member 4-like [Triticum aestivum]|nr:dnaJ homolog subfamily B member 4-like [Triticum aestivum]